MPRGDRTGPRGLGPMTGRAAGYCAGYPVPGYMNPIPGYGGGFGRGWGRGYGRGFGGGFGRGWGRGYGGRWRGYAPQYPYPPTGQIPPQQYSYPTYAYPPVYTPTVPPQSPQQELKAVEYYKKELEAEKADLEREMNEIEGRIKDLKTKLEKEREQPKGP